MPRDAGPPDIDERHRLATIDRATFERVLKHYNSSLFAAVDADGLDQQRYEEIPSAVARRQQEPHLEKEELVTLVTWKLKHGTFRPALKDLVQQNPAHDIKQTTRKSFAQYSSHDFQEALKTLATLRGIGPATASLALSVYDPKKAPFFSDELFRWAFFAPGNDNGWDRRIKYNAKEYAELRDRVAELLTRLDVTAVNAEKVAYVLGKGGLSANDGNTKRVQPSKRKAEDADRTTAATESLDEPAKDDEIRAAETTTARSAPTGRPKRQRTKPST